MSVELADDLARVLDGEPLGLSCYELARRVQRRRADVLAELRADPRFEHEGDRRGSRWRLAPETARRTCWDGWGPIVTGWGGLDPAGIPTGRRSQEIAP